MLGLGNSLISGSSLGEAWTPLKLANCLGWWDFSDTTTLYQSRASFTTKAGSNDDPIGRIKNKSTISTRLGNFLTTTSDAKRPLYKSADGGYAQFDGSNDGLYAARATTNTDVQSLDAGAVSVNEFSTAQIDAQTISIIAVVKPDSDAALTDETIFDTNGTNLGDGASNAWQFHTESSGDHGRMYFYYSDDANDDLAGSTDLGTNKQILTTISAAGANASKIYINTTQDGTATVDGNNVQTFTKDASSGGGTRGSGISMGVGINGSSLMIQNYWEGRIYEVLVFNQSLSDSNRDLVWNYLNTKHSIY